MTGYLGNSLSAFCGSGPPEDHDLLREARLVVHQEADVLRQVADGLDRHFCEAVRLLLRCSGVVVVTGVGKAGLIGRKLSATFSSTGTRSHFLHPTEARHGDLGCLGMQDVVVALSNSGETEELLGLTGPLREQGVPLVAVTRDRQSGLARAAQVVLSYGRHREAGPLALAPTCSTTAMLALGDALALVTSHARGFTAEHFSKFHPAGSLGRQLCPVRDVMRKGSDIRIADQSQTVREVMIQLSRPGRRSGAVMLVNAEGRLTGLFTDSDLARLFETRRDEQLDQAIELVMTRNPVTIAGGVLLPEAIHLMSERKLSELPVIDERRIPQGLLDITDVLQRFDDAEVRPSEDGRWQRRAA